MKKFLQYTVLILTLFSFQDYAQLDVIKEFPKVYKSQTIKDLTPVWITGNEILAMYTNEEGDTLFSRRTTNLGQSWSSQKVEQVTESDEEYLSEILLQKVSSGRLILMWKMTEGAAIISYSDDDGFSWTNIIQTGIYINGGRYFSLTELNEGELLLVYSAPTWQTRISSDNGITWSDQNYFIFPFPPPFRRGPLHIVKLSENAGSLLGIIISFYTSAIYSILSTDGGNSWSDTTRIINVEYNPEYYPYPGLSLKVLQDINNKIHLVYESDYETGFEDYKQIDLTTITSSDDGSSWQQDEKITSYLGDDHLTGITAFGEKIFICFTASRNESSRQGFYGIIGESEDKNTPPVILSSDAVAYDSESDEVDYRALVVDNEGVAKVVARLNQINFSAELFDDGLHNDSLANDNIFGNKLPYIVEGMVGDAYSMRVNKITLPFSNKGVIAAVNVGKEYSLEIQMTDIFNNVGLQIANANVPGNGSTGIYEEGTFLFSSGFFLSGYSNGEMWSNAVASSSLVEDYLAGKVGSDPRDPVNGIYVVNRESPVFGYSWQTWKDAVSLGAEFYDGDGDGFYNPVDKNWNGTWDENEDMPPLVGDEIAWCVYNDALPGGYRRWQSEPQGIEVRQTIFSSNEPELENVIFIRYSIVNTGTVVNLMDSVYFGIYEDADVGDASDDVAGCDTLLNSGFYYGNQPDDNYGINPPAFFSSILQGPVVETNNPADTAKNNYGVNLGSENIYGYKNLQMTSHRPMLKGNPETNDPNNADQARNYLLGKNNFGVYVDPCTFPYGQVRGGVDCHDVNPIFWYSGDPVTNVGWILNQNRDLRNVVSTGPFLLEKDKPQEIIVAYVLGRGTDYFNSITVARENVQRAIAEYESNFASMTYSPPAATNPVNSYELYQNYPNPFNPVTTIRYDLPQDGQVTIDIFDILGQRVTTLVNEYKRADRYEVTFTSTGLASGVYIYQLRVNDFVTSKKMILLR